VELDRPAGLAQGGIGQPQVVEVLPLAAAVADLAVDFQRLLVELDRLAGFALADIGVPPELYAAPSIGLTVEPIFAHDTLLPLER
jgi:hypothetical protein